MILKQLYNSMAMGRQVDQQRVPRSMPAVLLTVLYNLDQNPGLFECSEIQVGEVSNYIKFINS